MSPIEDAVNFYIRFREGMSISKDYEFVISDFQHTPYPTTIDKHHEIIAVDFSCHAAKEFVFNEDDLMHSMWIIFDTTNTKVFVSGTNAHTEYFFELVFVLHQHGIRLIFVL